MSKSKGNVYVLQDLIDQGHLALSFRFFFLQAHYRKQQAFSDDAMASADRGYRRLLASTAAARAATASADAARIAPWRARFRDAVRDDLNAPRALAEATLVLRAPELTPADQRALLAEFDAWLGLDLLSAALPAEPASESDPRIDALVAEREAARKRRDFATSDRIRDQLASEGVTIVDTPQGARWSRAAK
jgi:cysteinyl-tRNA synthetase